MSVRPDQENNIITGIIETESGNIIFSAENFKFTFMNPDFSNKCVAVKVDESGYIYGRTFDEKVIAIYSRENIEINGTRILNTWNYIVSKQYMPKQSMQSFDGIGFKNGAIKTIYPCNGLHKDIEKSSGNILTYRIEKDCKEYRLIHKEKSVIWQFTSIVNQRMSLEEGDSVSNSDAILNVIFDEEQKFSTFFNYYGYVCDLASFLTFRHNVSFEKVYLFHDIKISDGYYHEEFAECYVKRPDRVSQRKVVNIIPIRCVNDNVFENIFQNIIKVDEKHKGLPISIAPQDDADARMVNVEKIRNICSALEMELDLEGVRLSANDEMKKLTNLVKEIVKEHRKGNSPLSDKMYDYIFSNISYWSQPLAERAWEAWSQHEDEMKPFLRRYGISIERDNIQTFVKARNNITHNGFMGIRDDVSTTAFVLMGLVYCCALKRMGMEPIEIKNVMGRRLFE